MKFMWITSICQKGVVVLYGKFSLDLIISNFLEIFTPSLNYREKAS